MKKALFFVITLLLSMPLLAQHPLVGTWEMVSVTGTNAEGKKFSLDTTQIREVKIITPTHYMLIAQDVRGDSLVFNRCYGGTVTFDGNKYVETPIQASIQIFDNVKTDFTWRVDGDVFTQSGSITRPDGKKIILDALKFRRVKSTHKYPNNPAVGTWSQVSSTFTQFDGTKGSHTNATATRLQIITPTHWMRVSHMDSKFEGAMGGSYTMEQGKTLPNAEYASTKNSGKVELTENVEGDKMVVKGKLTSSDGKTMTWDDVFERLR
ncbi:MAG TPA: hypothetical protein VK666_16105 [Chryseolinea sp.]|nr:hypothetical protein [Chryseolinea sp.]